MIQFNSTIGTFDNAIKQASRWFRKKPGNNVIRFDESAGSGLFLMTELEKGLFIRIWDYTLKDDTRFHIQPVDYDYPVMCMLSYLLVPDGFLVEAGNEWTEKIKKVKNLNRIVFSVNQTEFSCIVQAGGRAKALDIFFSLEWLLQQFPAAKSEQLKTGLSGRKERKPVFIRTIPADDYRTVSEIMEKVFSNDRDNMFLKSRILMLVSQAVNTILPGQGKENALPAGNAAVMIKVEQRLNSVLHEKLPGLRTIAKEFSMSESTLKRQFRQMYGKAVYEYYLQKKMELARRTLMEKDITVAQVAYSLGYEKVSPFIRIFKKYFGISPGALRISENKTGKNEVNP